MNSITFRWSIFIDWYGRAYRSHSGIELPGNPMENASSIWSFIIFLSGHANYQVFCTHACSFAIARVWKFKLFPKPVGRTANILHALAISCVIEDICSGRKMRLNPSSEREFNVQIYFFMNMMNTRWNVSPDGLSINSTTPRQSETPFAHERRFSKSQGLPASVSFSPFPLPLLPLFALSPTFARPKNENSSARPKKRLLRRL